MCERGGNRSCMNSWPAYYKDVDGLIFVIDLGLREHAVEMETLIDALTETDHGERLLKGVPVLLLLNKRDYYVEERAAELNVVTNWIMDYYVRRFRELKQPSNPIKIVATIGTQGDGCLDGLDWFGDTISSIKDSTPLKAYKSVFG